MEEYSLISHILVSIIIPVYNSQQYLESTIQSALAQTWPNIEVIVVDDGSTDNSLTIIKSFGDKINLLQQKNKSASAARNNGLSVAKGKYIQFLDADDLLSADKIEKQVIALNRTVDKIAVCYTVYFFDEKKKNAYPLLKEKDYVYTTDDSVEFITKLWGGHDFHGWMVQTNAWLTPRSLIERFGNWNESLTVDDDGEFFARMVLNSKGIIQTNGLNYYRKYENQKSNLSFNKTKKGLSSSVAAALLKKKHLFNTTSSESSKKAIFKLLTSLMVSSYIAEPELFGIIQAELNQLPKFKYKIKLGGRIINIIAKIFGWKYAKWLSYFYYKYFKKINKEVYK